MGGSCQKVDLSVSLCILCQMGSGKGDAVRALKAKGMSVRQIADVLEVTTQNVYYHLSRLPKSKGAGDGGGVPQGSQGKVRGRGR